MKDNTRLGLERKQEESDYMGELFQGLKLGENSFKDQRRNQLCLGAGDQEGGKGPLEKRAYLRARKKRFRADSLVEERLIKGIRMIYW